MNDIETRLNKKEGEFAVDMYQLGILANKYVTASKACKKEITK